MRGCERMKGARPPTRNSGRRGIMGRRGRARSVLRSVMVKMCGV